ncbi:hypothetical protein ABZ806_29610 [Spirillospora sp. NPDC047418]
METNIRIPSFATVKRAIKVYAALSAAALVVVIVASSTGHTVNTFMWVRAVVLPVVAVPIYWTAVLASRGSQRAFERLRAVAIVLPVAIIGVDLIPGICPPWYTAMQVVCVLPVLRTALTLRRRTSPDNR